MSTYSPMLTIPLDIPNVEIISTETQENKVVIEVKSSSKTTFCGICGQEIFCNYGCGEPKELRHLPILGRKTYILIRPKRGECKQCRNTPTTTQQVEWYDSKSPHTKAYDDYLMKLLIGSTIEDVHLKEQVGYDAILGSLNRQVATQVNWDEVDEISKIGIDEIAMTKGHRNFAAVITAYQKQGKAQVLAILEDRKKRQ